MDLVYGLVDSYGQF